MRLPELGGFLLFICEAMNGSLMSFFLIGGEAPVDSVIPVVSSGFLPYKAAVVRNKVVSF